MHHDTVVYLKDGRSFCGPIWEFNAKEGYITIVEDPPSGKLYFKDMVSATTYGRVDCMLIGPENIDEIARAKKMGWVDEYSLHPSRKD